MKWLADLCFDRDKRSVLRALSVIKTKNKVDAAFIGPKFVLRRGEVNSASLAAKPGVAMKGTRWVGNIPEQWIDEAAAIRRLARLSPIDASLEASKFADYWIAKAGAGATKMDWHRTWQNWVRNARQAPTWLERSHPDYVPVSSPPPANYRGDFDSVEARQSAIVAMQERFRKAEEWRQTNEGRAILAGVKPRPSVPPIYDPEAMRQAREELGISVFQPNSQAEANCKAIDHAKQPRNIKSGQDELANWVGKGSFAPGLPQAKSQKPTPKQQEQERYPDQDDLAKRMGDDQWVSGDPS